MPPPAYTTCFALANGLPAGETLAVGIPFGIYPVVTQFNAFDAAGNFDMAVYLEDAIYGGVVASILVNAPVIPQALSAGLGDLRICTQFAEDLSGGWLIRNAGGDAVDVYLGGFIFSPAPPQPGPYDTYG